MKIKKVIAKYNFDVQKKIEIIYNYLIKGIFMVMFSTICIIFANIMFVGKMKRK